MKRYSAERKASVIQKMMPPHNTPIPELVAETGIPDATLYTWRKQARVDFGFQIDRTFHSPKHGLGYELERKKVSLTLYEFGYLIELGNAPAVVFKLVFDGSF